eukprot:TRINITY_DN79494_c0_g1_i1.p1 TRINITY_DN79494_c0_g1~~TRINITY_DN79494_c0_g1_i1.p1  ORF type:complete len:496 (-),score=40.71 TRINITY_DN79494_c0_g1_i1:9-1496(-)
MRIASIAKAVPFVFSFPGLPCVRRTLSRPALLGRGASSLRGSQKHAVHTKPFEVRKRLSWFADTLSLEVAPGDVHPAQPSNGKQAPVALLELLARTDDVPALAPGTSIFVNMVKTNMEHFGEVSAASATLNAAGFRSVPHVPAARFSHRDEFRQTLKSLVATGAFDFLVVGGNDLHDMRQAANCVYHNGAQTLLAEELAFLKACNVTGVSLAGHPDGHPAFGGDAARTMSVLLDKVRSLLISGFNVRIVTQFCFDVRKLIKWLVEMRRALLGIKQELETSSHADVGLPGTPSGAHSGLGKVSIHVGISGPTSLKRLKRIAAICDVPALLAGSAFQLLDSDKDGLIQNRDLEQQAQLLGIRQESITKLLVQHAHGSGLLTPLQFYEFLLDDALESSSDAAQELAACDGKAIASKVVSGPSVFVGAGSGGVPASDDVVCPEELVLTLALFCERQQIPKGEVNLHMFPFGGISKTVDLVKRLRAGTWPEITADDTEFV